MSTTQFPIWIVLYGIVIIVSIFETIVLAFFTLKSSKKYEAYVLELKKRGKYQEWRARNKAPDIFTKITIGFIILFVLAFFVSDKDDFVTFPTTILTISRILVYAFYPYILVTVLIYILLYRKALKDLSKQIDVP